MASLNLDDLHPLVANTAQQLVELAEAEGIEILVTSTLRTFDEQAYLFAIGRTKPGDIVTNAKAGESWHNFGLASDDVPLVNGKAVWDSPFWNRIGELGSHDVDATWDNVKTTNGNLDVYQPNTTRGDHAVTLVGYTPDRFIVRNSWGTTKWGAKDSVTARCRMHSRRLRKHMG